MPPARPAPASAPVPVPAPAPAPSRIGALPAAQAVRQEQRWAVAAVSLAVTRRATV
ncbi:hypothetical protein ACWGQ9_06135 [Streptomyces parvus]